ncbi:hypothetical protein U1Q18_025030 [Sarracenia purpurea var. burkii]
MLYGLQVVLGFPSQTQEESSLKCALQFVFCCCCSVQFALLFVVAAVCSLHYASLLLLQFGLRCSSLVELFAVCYVVQQLWELAEAAVAFLQQLLFSSLGALAVWAPAAVWSSLGALAAACLVLLKLFWALAGFSLVLVLLYAFWCFCWAQQLAWFSSSFFWQGCSFQWVCAFCSSTSVM